MSDELCEAPNNIIDLMPYLEGQKFNWTVDMTRAVLDHGNIEPLKVQPYVPGNLVLNKEEFLKP